MPDSILFLFAHQDDEVGVSTVIAREVRRGARVVCAFLTDGGRNTRSSIRDRESLSVLTRLGVATSDVHFIGSVSAIGDLHLVEHLDRAYGALESAAGSIAFTRLVTLAWEGGHPDHDAAHLVALAFARRHGITAIEQFPLYHGRSLRGSLFRALSPLTTRGLRTTRLGFREGWRASALCFRYPSQRRSWIALFPEVFVKLAVLRRQYLQAVDFSAVDRRPHEGRLLYERRYGVTWDQFLAQARGFIDARIRGHRS